MPWLIRPIVGLHDWSRVRRGSVVSDPNTSHSCLRFCASHLQTMPLGFACVGLPALQHYWVWLCSILNVLYLFTQSDITSVFIPTVSSPFPTPPSLDTYISAACPVGYPRYACRTSGNQDTRLHQSGLGVVPPATRKRSQPEPESGRRRKEQSLATNPRWPDIANYCTISSVDTPPRMPRHLDPLQGPRSRGVLDSREPLLPRARF